MHNTTREEQKRQHTHAQSTMVGYTGDNSSRPTAARTVRHQPAASMDLRSRDKDRVPHIAPPPPEAVDTGNHLPFNKFDLLEFEFHLLKYFCPRGMYVMPTTDSIERWHGVLFLNTGLYTKAIFKFHLKFEDYPAHIPKVIFDTEIFHPLVHPKTGDLDLFPKGGDLLCDVSKKLKELREAPSLVGHPIATLVLEYIKIIFFIKKFFKIVNSHNPTAGQFWNTDQKKYERIARDCAKRSVDRRFHCSQTSILKFREEWKESEHNILKKIQDLCKENKEEEGIVPRQEQLNSQTFIKWLATYYTEIYQPDSQTALEAPVYSPNKADRSEL